MRSVATSTAIILLSIVLAASAEESVAVQRNLGKIWCARAGSAPPSVYKTAESGCERSQYRVVDTKFEDNGLRWSVERRPLLAIKFPKECVISEPHLTIHLARAPIILLPGIHLPHLPHLPHPHKDDSGPSGGSSGGGSSGGGSSGGGSSGGGSSGSSSGGSSGGSGSSSSSSSAAAAPEKRSTNGLVMVGAAVAAGAGVAAAAIRRGRVIVTEEPHALAGSVNRRMIMFNHLAGKAGKNAARPQRVVHTTVDGDYEGGTMQIV